ncbi:MAG TPA: LLM class F420-dependent oxidoreductase [Anaerolineales bacterium]|nr:LLM class F420-dependent oxidoreductase [Anaerolineales bacterium]
MKFGVHVFPTETSIQPDELARAAEDRGLDSVWFSEHSHIPLRFLNAPDGTFRLPDYYWQTYDIFVAMTLAAAATKSIRVASGVALVIERDPIFLAKETATIDLLSKGRFIFGVGAGWLESEMSDHGVEYRTRFQLLREQLQAIQEIWKKDESEFHGRFVNFDKMKAFPKPYQKPRPPIIMGGSGEKALACAAELCDGWAPWMLEWSKAKPAIAQLQELAASYERKPDSLEISLFEGSIPDERSLAEMEESGVSKIILTIFGENREEALPKLDLLAEIIPQ